MGCCTHVYVRRACVSVLLIVAGVLLGIYLNYYGLVLENIHMNMMFGMEDSANTSSVVKKLISNLPMGYKFTNKSQVREDQFVVPNIVHFIWFGQDRNMSFVNYISILSAHLMQKPEQIMLHCDHLPVGEHWERLWRQVPIRIMHRKPRDTIYGQKLKHIYHKGDVAKLDILRQYGGIYLDYDVIVVRSLDPLRKYDMTLGKEKPPKFIAGIIVARKNALFLNLWLESYRNNYRGNDWDYNCARVTYKLYKERPDLLHVEPYKLTTPDWLDRSNLWDKVIDWQGQGLYVIHVMVHLNKKVYTPENVKALNSTFGEVVRYIYYGSPQLL